MRTSIAAVSQPQAATTPAPPSTPRVAGADLIAEALATAGAVAATAAVAGEGAVTDPRHENFGSLRECVARYLLMAGRNQPLLDISDDDLEFLHFCLDVGYVSARRTAKDFDMTLDQLRAFFILRGMPAPFDL